MSRSTTKQFRAPFASAGSHADGRDEAICYIISTIFGSLIWLRDTTATGERALGGRTCRKRKAPSDRFRRRNCTGTFEPHQMDQAWADWQRGPVARGGRGGQRQRERGPQKHRCRGTAVRHTRV